MVRHQNTSGTTSAASSAEAADGSSSKSAVCGSESPDSKDHLFGSITGMNSGSQMVGVHMGNDDEPRAAACSTNENKSADGMSSSLAMRPPLGSHSRTSATVPMGLMIPPLEVRAAADYASRTFQKEEEDAQEAKKEYQEAVGLAGPDERDVTESHPAPYKVFMDAASRGAMIELSELVSDGIDVDAADFDGRTALMASSELGQTACVVLLLEGGADAGRVDCEGYTPLHKACFEGHADCVKVLLEASIDVDRPCDHGNTPLIACCSKGHVSCAELLIDSDAEVHLTNEEGSSALHCCCFHGHADCTRLLLNAGANADAEAEDGGTPLYHSCVSGHVACVQLLLGAKAEVDHADRAGATPLYVSCWAGHPSIVSLLLEASADADHTMHEGQSPLLAAAYYGHSACAQLLLDANVDAEPLWRGQTPLDVAFARRQDGCVSVLEGRGLPVEDESPRDETDISYLEEDCEPDAPAPRAARRLRRDQDLRRSHESLEGSIESPPPCNGTASRGETWQETAERLQKELLLEKEKRRAQRGDRDKLRSLEKRMATRLEEAEAAFDAEMQAMKDRLVAKDEEMQELKESFRRRLEEREEQIYAEHSEREARLRAQLVSRETETQAQITDSAGAQAALRNQLKVQEDKLRRLEETATKVVELETALAAAEKAQKATLVNLNLQLANKEEQMEAALLSMQAQYGREKQHREAQFVAIDGRNRTSSEEDEEALRAELAAKEEDWKSLGRLLEEKRETLAPALSASTAQTSGEGPRTPGRSSDSRPRMKFH